MFKSLFTKFQSIWKPHKSPADMDYPFRYVLSKEYKDPNKIAAKLDEYLGKDGWGKLEVGFFSFKFQPVWLDGKMYRWILPCSMLTIETSQVVGSEYVVYTQKELSKVLHTW